MKKYNRREWLILIIDLIGMFIFLLGPFVLASTLKSTWYFLTYLISWIPGGLIFGFASYLAKKEEEKMICFKDMTFCTESTCEKFGPCPRTFNEETQEKADKWWGRLEGPAPVCFFAETPKCYKKQEDEDV